MAVAPTARLPTAQTPVPLVNVPVAVEAPTSVTPVGSVLVLVSCTPEASDGPLFFTVTVYTRLPVPEPATTGSGASVFVTMRSTCRLTVVIAVFELFPGVASIVFGSEVPIVAVLLIVELSASLLRV